MNRKNDVPLLFRPDGRAVQKPKKSLGVFLNEEARTLTINGISYSLEMLEVLAPLDGTPRGPFWVQREGNSVALFELDEERDFEQALDLESEEPSVTTTKLPEN